MQRTIIIAATLTAMMGTPALAQRPANDGGPISPPAWTAWTAPAPATRRAERVQARRMWRAGEGAYAAEPYRTVTTRGLYENGNYVGWDPDPNIRFQLLRDPNGAGSQ